MVNSYIHTQSKVATAGCITQITSSHYKHRQSSSLMNGTHSHNIPLHNINCTTVNSKNNIFKF